MSVFVWIGVGLGGLLLLSLLAGLAISRILGTIGHEIAQLLEAEPWASAPLTRDTERLPEAPQIGSGASARNLASRSTRR